MVEDKGIIEKFNDGTETYTIAEANKLLGTIEPKKFTLADATLLILYAQPKPIFGRILIVKEIFLLIDQILKSEVQDPRFVPYHYGPYSFSLGNAISNLEFAGFIDRNGKKNSKVEQFQLTIKGNVLAAHLWNQLPQKTQEEIRIKRKGWDQLGVDGILRLVYRDYKSFAKESYVQGKYKAITWGKGINEHR